MSQRWNQLAPKKPDITRYLAKGLTFGKVEWNIEAVKKGSNQCKKSKALSPTYILKN